MVSTTGSTIINRSYSPRVAILGSSTFSQEGHSIEDRTVKINDEPSNTLAKQIERMEVSSLHRFLTSTLGIYSTGISVIELVQDWSFAIKKRNWFFDEWSWRKAWKHVKYNWSRAIQRLQEAVRWNSGAKRCQNKITQNGWNSNEWNLKLETKSSTMWGKNKWNGITSRNDRAHSNIQR